MKIDFRKDEESLLVRLEGRLDTTTAPELERCLGENLEGVTDLIFDFTGLAYISSAGLRVVLSAQKKMNGIKGKMKLLHVNELIMEILESVGFLDILTVENEA